jgi:agmatinase
MIHPTFIGAPSASPDTLTGAQVAVFGAAEATSYTGEASHSATAPAAIRQASLGFARQLGQLDFDLGWTMLPTKGDHRGIVDLGDVPTTVTDPDGNAERIRETTAAVLAAGAVPIVLGGDDSVPIPVLEGFEGHGPLTILQIDAHADWGDVIRGKDRGYGSPMRRASEMPWVTGMVQVGLRGLGSGQAWQIDDARAWGSTLITSREFRHFGPEAIAAAIPDGARVVLSIDCDGFDPAAFPAVAMPTPGGLSYDEMVGLLHAVAGRATLAGLILAEYVPERDDPHRRCATFAARIAAVTAALMLGKP